MVPFTPYKSGLTNIGFIESSKTTWTRINHGSKIWNLTFSSFGFKLKVSLSDLKTISGHFLAEQTSFSNPNTNSLNEEWRLWKLDALALKPNQNEKPSSALAYLS